MFKNIDKVEDRLEKDLEKKGDFDDIEYRLEKDDLVDNELSIGASQEKLIESSKKRYKLLNKSFSLKESLDRLGYGLGAHQWVTIFFFISGAGAFMVGMINALRDIIGDSISLFINEYSRVRTLNKNVLSFAGIFFGFSFLGLVLGIRLHSITIYALSVVLGSIGIVTYGQIYTQLLNQQIKHEKKVKFLKEIAHYGVLITAVAFLVSGWILQKTPSGTTADILGYTIPLTGYFLIFELTAIMFILSGFILSNIPTVNIDKQKYPFKQFFKEYLHGLKVNRKHFIENKTMKILFFASLFISVVQSLGASFYGYYIYRLFQNVYFGGFLNVAIIFSIAIVASFMGPILTKFVQKNAGLAPMFVFGSLLLSLLPLILLYNKSFYPVIAAAALAIIGASILGVAQGLLTRKLLSLSERKTFYESLRSFSAIPFLVLVGIGSLAAGIYSFEHVFQAIIIILLLIVTPTYFSLVIKSNKEKQF